MTAPSGSARCSAAYDPDCTRCPRLARYLEATRAGHPEYWARPVPSFGAARPKLLIVGLAPGMHGANRTGRPFTGDFAGILLYRTLYELGLASAPESAAADDALRLIGARIANAVKCVPPGNKPLPEEIGRCNSFLKEELAALTTVRVYLALGRIAHDAVLLARDLKRSHYAFGHGREHALSEAHWLIDSYHCSRYNTQTRRLTAPMFREVVARACSRAGLR
ncbi:MAG TPA: uracil-DNA glycosylase [Steroidobacteraceae bacterium]|jgi:uracil-DNA glycosylase family 4|nr:uracil-DNA glycosylase [Steroidobacteraceae bacterium]